MEEEVETSITRQHDSRTLPRLKELILLRQEKTDIIKFHTYKTITQFRNKRHLVVDTIPSVSPNFKFREEIHSFALIYGLGFLT